MRQVCCSKTCRTLCLIASIVTLTAISCNKQEATPPPEIAAVPAQNAAVQPTTPPAEVAAAPAEEKAPGVQPIVVKEVGFTTPESILYDEKNDVYLVSNINGTPDGKDNNGFISRVSPDGTVAALKWIEGGINKVELNAPKGMAFRDDTLYVADIHCVRMFDRMTGASKGKIDIKGAMFLNDLSAAPNGTIYVSDSGLKNDKETLIATGKDAIYKIDAKNKAKKLISGKDLHQPNGLLAEDGGVFVAAMGGKEMYRVSDSGKIDSTMTVPGGSLDGLVKLKNGDMVVSSWEMNAVYRSNPSGQFATVVSDLKSPADIGYDAGRDRLLVPLLTENAIQIQPIAEPNMVATAPKETGTSSGTVASSGKPTSPSSGSASMSASSSGTSGASSGSASSSGNMTTASSGTAGSSSGSAASSKTTGLKSNAPEPETAAAKEEKTSGSAKSGSSKADPSNASKTEKNTSAGTAKPTAEPNSTSTPKN